MNLEQLLDNVKQNQSVQNTKIFIESLINSLMTSDYNDIFWAFLFNSTPRIYTNTLDAPMAVGVVNNKIQLMVNSEKFQADWTAKNLQAILRHEGMHILMNHLHIYKDAIKQNGLIVNLATDCEINQRVANLPDGCVTLHTISEQTGIPVNEIDEKAGSAYYYNLLMKHSNLQGKGSNSSGNRSGEGTLIDTHEAWGNASEISAEDLAKALVQKARQETVYHSRGVLPGDLQELIDQLNAPSVVPWQRLVKQQMGRISHGKKRTINRLNRRRPYDLTKKGILNDHINPILVAMDVSGSISKNDLSYFYNEVKHLNKKMNLPIKLIQFDTAINHVTEFSRASKLDMTAYGRGGTVFQTVFDFLKENKYPRETSVFVFSDGYGESSVVDHGYKNINWILTEDGELSVETSQPVIRLNQSEQ